MQTLLLSASLAVFVNVCSVCNLFFLRFLKYSEYSDMNSVYFSFFVLSTMSVFRNVSVSHLVNLPYLSSSVCLFLSISLSIDLFPYLSVDRSIGRSIHTMTFLSFHSISVSFLFLLLIPPHSFSDPLSQFTSYSSSRPLPLALIVFSPLSSYPFNTFLVFQSSLSFSLSLLLLFSTTVNCILS